MVIGAIGQKISQAAAEEERRVRLPQVDKLSRKDFIKKFTPEKLFSPKVADEKWYASAYFGNKEEAGQYYDCVKKIKEEEKQEDKDITKLSKEQYIKKYCVYRYPDFKYKVNGLNHNEVMGYPKYKSVSHEEAEKIKNPGFLKSYFGLAEYESLLSPPRNPKDVGESWELVNKKGSKKTTSTKNNNNLSDELEKLKKLYKDGTLSKEEFTKAKAKLLK